MRFFICEKNVKRSFISLFLCFLGSFVWGQTLIIDNEIKSERLEINASEYDTIVLRNSKFEEPVVISANANLKTLMIFNCDFIDIVSLKDNKNLVTLTIASGNFSKHLYITDNNVEKTAILNDNIINGFFQFSRNNITEKCSISNSKIDRDFSCFENTFSSMFQINTTDLRLRSVLYKNYFNEFELNGTSFNYLLINDNYLEKSIGFADCIITAHFTVRKMSDIGNADSRRSVNFYNSSVFGNVYLEDIDTTIFLIDLWQLDFFQDIYIDYDRLVNNIKLITDRIIHNPQNIENIGISNPYKELSNENLQKFNSLFSKIKNSYEKRGDKESKINIIKWEYRYKNSFNTPFQKLLNTLLYFISFELFLNLHLPIIISLVICLICTMIYVLRKDDNNQTKYLKLDNYKLLKKYLIAFIVSTSVFCNLPLATKKMREEKAREITWIQGMIGMALLMIIAAIIARLVTI